MNRVSLEHKAILSLALAVVLSRNHDDMPSRPPHDVDVDISRLYSSILSSNPTFATISTRSKVNLTKIRVALGLITHKSSCEKWDVGELIEETTDDDMMENVINPFVSIIINEFEDEQLVRALYRFKVAIDTSREKQPFIIILCSILEKVCSANVNSMDKIWVYERCSLVITILRDSVHSLVPANDLIFLEESYQPCEQRSIVDKLGEKTFLQIHRKSCP